MRSIYVIAIKDLKIISRDGMGLFFMFAFPVMMGVFFGVVSGSFAPDKVEMTIAVIDKDNSTMSKKFVAGIQDSKGMTVKQNMTVEEASNEVRKGKMTGLIIIPEKFGESAGIMWAENRAAIKIGVDPSRKAEFGMLQGIVMQASGKLMIERFQDPESFKPHLKEARKKIAEDEELPLTQKLLLQGMMNSLDVFIESIGKVQNSEGDEAKGKMPQMELVEVKQLDIVKPESNSVTSKIRNAWDISFPQAMLWGVLGCAAAFAISLVRERTEGTLFRLQVAPIDRYFILAGKALSCFIAVVFVIAVMTFLGYLLGMRPLHWDLLLLASICIAVCFVGVMMLMSVIGRTEQSVGGAGWGIFLIFSMFGGGMLPLAFMPSFMKTLSNFSPVKWGIYSLEGAIWRDFSFVEILGPCGILIGIGVVCFLLGNWRMKRMA